MGLKTSTEAYERVMYIRGAERNIFMEKELVWGTSVQHCHSQIS